VATYDDARGAPRYAHVDIGCPREGQEHGIGLSHARTSFFMPWPLTPGLTALDAVEPATDTLSAEGVAHLPSPDVRDG
jgi:hypothetical protein